MCVANCSSCANHGDPQVNADLCSKSHRCLSVLVAFKCIMMVVMVIRQGMPRCRSHLQTTSSLQSIRNNLGVLLLHKNRKASKIPRKQTVRSAQARVRRQPRLRGHLASKPKSVLNVKQTSSLTYFGNISSTAQRPLLPNSPVEK